MPTDFIIPQEEIKTLLEQATRQELILWDKELVVAYLLPSGSLVVGRGAVLDPANFDLEKGREVAKEDAIKQLWQREGYLRQVERSDEQPSDLSPQQLLEQSEVHKSSLFDVAIVSARLPSGFTVTGKAIIGDLSIEQAYQLAQVDLLEQLQYLEAYRKTQTDPSKSATEAQQPEPMPEEAQSESPALDQPTSPPPSIL
jgi:hypothetical protein